MLDGTQKLELLKRLSGRRFQAVDVANDRLLLHFEPLLTIDARAPVSVRPNGERRRAFNDSDFRDALTAQISKAIGLVTVIEGKSFTIGFDDGSGLSVSLLPTDCSGKVAVVIKTDGYYLAI